MQPDSIRIGIESKLLGTTNNFKTAITTGTASRLFFGENPTKPELVIYPYVIFYFVGGSIEKDSINRFENPVIRFVLYDNAVNQKRIFLVAEYLDTLIDEKVLTITSITNIITQRITTLNNVFKNDIDNWQLPIDYEIQLQVAR
jgi:hypothetical protein